MDIISYVIIYLIMCIAIGVVADKTERSFQLYFLLSIFITPVTVLLIILLLEQNKHDPIFTNVKRRMDK